MSFRRIPGMRGRGRGAGGFMGLGGGRGGGGRFQWRLERGMLLLIVFSAVGFAVCAAEPRLREHLVVLPWRTFHRLELWQPLSGLFVHLSLGSFILNAIFIWLMGSFIERAIGRVEAIVLYVASGAIGYFVAAAAALKLAPNLPLAGAEPALFAMMAASGFIYGRQQVLLFGAMPARADIIAWIFCIIWIGAALLERDFVRVISVLAAGAVAFVLIRRGTPSLGLSSRLARLRLWWLRRRYKVLDGGKSRAEEKKKWMN